MTAALLALFISTLGTPAAQAAPSFGVNQNAQALKARHKGAKGAILGAQFWCSKNGSALPDSYTLTIKKKGRTVYSKTVKGSAKTLGQGGYLQARVKAGSYRVTTRAWCGTSAKTVKKSLKVKTLKDSQTVSPAEMKKVKKKMTVRQVEHVVGGRFDDCWSNEAQTRYTCHKLSTKWDTGVFFIFWDGVLDHTREGTGDY